VSTLTKLSLRELRAIRLVAHGLSTAEIAKRAKAAPSSIDVYLASAQRKLGLHRRTQLVLWALKVGLVHLEDIKLPSAAKKSEVEQ
jgi:DNA-binding CsgD family transcriptional regulator